MKIAVIIFVVVFVLVFGFMILKQVFKKEDKVNSYHPGGSGKDDNDGPLETKG